jgi:hypothetical protein
MIVACVMFPVEMSPVVVEKSSLRFLALCSEILSKQIIELSRYA